jgi:hypothetical protein
MGASSFAACATPSFCHRAGVGRLAGPNALLDVISSTSDPLVSQRRFSARDLRPAETPAVPPFRSLAVVLRLQYKLLPRHAHGLHCSRPDAHRR